MTVAIGLMVGGLAIKSGLFPFHFWMPDTYGRATPASAGILSGVVSKGYIFLLIKIIYQVIGIEVFAASGIQDLLLVLGIGGMVVCSISAIQTGRLRTMIAYSSGAQIGYIYMGLGMGTQAALLAAPSPSLCCSSPGRGWPGHPAAIRTSVPCGGRPIGLRRQACCSP